MSHFPSDASLDVQEDASRGSVVAVGGNGRTDILDPPKAGTDVVEAFADFYRRQYKPVLSIVIALSGSRTASEELTQDAFAKAHGHWSMLQVHANREAWIRRVAINGALSWRRRRAAELRALARLSRERPTPFDLPALPDQLWSAVRRLPRNQAIAITLRYHDDRSIGDIADVLGCSAATVRVHLHRGRATLAASLDLDPPDREATALPSTSDRPHTTEESHETR